MVSYKYLQVFAAILKAQNYKIVTGIYGTHQRTVPKWPSQLSGRVAHKIRWYNRRLKKRSSRKIKLVDCGSIIINDYLMNKIFI